MTSISTRRTVAAIAVAFCVGIPTTAHADGDAAELPDAETPSPSRPSRPRTSAAATTRPITPA